MALMAIEKLSLALLAAVPAVWTLYE